MRPCPEFYVSDAQRTPAAAPHLLTRLCRTRVDQGARAARASQARLPRRNARGSGASLSSPEPPRVGDVYKASQVGLEGWAVLDDPVEHSRPDADSFM
jgi:hypothetical protein